MTKRKAKKASSIPSLEPAAKKSRIILVSHPIPKLLSQKSGNLFVCGQNNFGQLGLNPDDVIEKTRPEQLPGFNNIIEVKAGGIHSLYLTTSGEVWSFGCNDEGALGRNTDKDGSETEPTKVYLPGKAVKISAGDSHSACLLDVGRAYAWGSFRVR
jgi:regulator of chromosome condensation